MRPYTDAVCRMLYRDYKMCLDCLTNTDNVCVVSAQTIKFNDRPLSLKLPANAVVAYTRLWETNSWHTGFPMGIMHLEAATVTMVVKPIMLQLNSSYLGISIWTLGFLGFFLKDLF